MTKFTVPLVAVKRLKYATRAIMPGDEFSAKPNDAKILIGLKRAREADRAIGTIPAPPARLARQFRKFDNDGDGKPGGSAKPEPSEDLAPLRAAYTEKLGKRPFPGWDADELRRRMEAAAS